MKRSTCSFLASLGILLFAAGMLIHVTDEEAGTALTINELLSSSSNVLSEEASHEEWVELYNGTDTDINLAGYGLSKNPEDPLSWQFPDVTIAAGSYLLVYASGLDTVLENGEIHTDYRLPAGDGYLCLSAPDGRLIDEITYQDCEANISFGRYPDGGETALLNKPTPGSANASFVSRIEKSASFTETAVYSVPGGYYSDPVFLKLKAPAGCTILYTLDSTDPEITSAVYEGPILLTDVSSQPNRYANINTRPQSAIFSGIGQEPVQKGTVVKTRLYRDGELSSRISCQTYFVGLTTTLTTISVVTDPANLFDYQKGIYVPGYIYGRSVYTSAPDSSVVPSLWGNYSISGETAERPAHVEIYGFDGSLRISQGVGIRTVGGRHSTSYPAKPLRLYASRKYDAINSFTYPWFPWASTSDPEFSELVVRSSNYFIENSFLDGFLSTLFMDDGLGVQSYEPALLYINGEYWGFTALRDRIDEKYVASRFQLDPKNLILLKSSHEEDLMYIVAGTAKDHDSYLSLFDYAATQDMSESGNYQYLADRIDMDNFIRNCWARIFFDCEDWPDNNVRAFRQAGWQENGREENKWRFILYDLDLSCADYEHNTLLYAMGKEPHSPKSYWSGYPDLWSTQLLAGLMDSPLFRQQFLAVYEEYRSTIFDPSFLTERFDQMLDQLGDDLERSSNRWLLEPTPTGNFLSVFTGKIDQPDHSANTEHVERIRDFLQNRLPVMDNYMKQLYHSYGEDIL